jgi:hypothetical protein
MIAEALTTGIKHNYTHVNTRLYERCRHGLGPTTRGCASQRTEGGWSHPDGDGAATGDQPTHAQPTRDRPAEHNAADADSNLPSSPVQGRRLARGARVGQVGSPSSRFLTAATAMLPLGLVLATVPIFTGTARWLDLQGQLSWLLGHRVCSGQSAMDGPQPPPDSNNARPARVSAQTGLQSEWRLASR